MHVALLALALRLLLAAGFAVLRAGRYSVWWYCLGGSVAPDSAARCTQLPCRPASSCGGCCSGSKAMQRACGGSQVKPSGVLYAVAARHAVMLPSVPYCAARAGGQTAMLNRQMRHEAAKAGGTK